MKLKVLTLFAGYGGDKFALRKAGIEYEEVGFSEIDKFAIQCHEQNHKGKNFGDITKIVAEDLPDFDLLTGGFPCQDVSVAGKQDLSKGRTILFNEIIRIAETKQPKYMLLENVKGLLNKKFKEFFEYTLKELDRIGYNVVKFYDNKKKRTLIPVFNSKEYGIPQNRERVFYICSRKDINFNFVSPKKEELKLFFKDILEDIPFREIPNFLYGNYNGKLRLDNCKKVTDNIMHTLTINRTHANQYLLNKDKTLCRNFTKKESMRCMGFTNNEINIDRLTDNQVHKLAGNGFDINLVSKIFANIFRNTEYIK